MVVKGAHGVKFRYDYDFYDKIHPMNMVYADVDTFPSDSI